MSSAARCSAVVRGSVAAPTTAISAGPASTASATASPAPPARGKRAAIGAEHAQRRHGRVPVPGRAGQRGIAQQRPRGREGARRAGPVGRVGRPVQQPLAVVGGVVEAAVAVAEPGQRGLQELTGERHPAGLPGHPGQGEEPVGQAGVVVEHPGARARLARARGPAQPPVRQVHGGEQVRRLQRRGHEPWLAQEQPALGERGDREPVPGGDHLVVAARAHPRRRGRPAALR